MKKNGREKIREDLIRYVEAVQAMVRAGAFPHTVEWDVDVHTSALRFGQIFAAPDKVLWWSGVDATGPWYAVSVEEGVDLYLKAQGLEQEEKT